MRDILSLTRVLIKNIFQRGSKSEHSVGKIILYIFAFGYIGAIIGYLSYQVIKTLIEINQAGIFINFILLGIAVFMLVQAIFTSLNVLFFSKDIEYVLPLPISNIKILVSKFNVLIVSEYILELIVGLIPLIIYGCMTGAGFLYYLIMVIVLLLYPILPIMISSSLIIIIMRFTNIVKNKDFVQYITVGLTFVIVIAVQLMTNSQSQISNVELAEKVLEINGLVDVYKNYFITLSPTINALLNYNNLEGLKNILILFIETFAIYAVIIFIGSKLYLKTVTKGFSGGTSKNKKLNNERDYIQNNELKTYVEKEFKTLVKNPVFFMQCVLPSFLFPILMSIPLVNILKDDSARGFFIEIKKAVETPFGFSICLSAIAFFFMFNFVSLTAISRDGENAKFMKYIPISLYRQCTYKVMPSIILNILPLAYVVMAIKAVIPTISWLILFYVTIISFLLNVFQSYLMIIVDLKRPKLVWSTEYAVVKQNLNMIFEMLFGVAIMFIMIMLSKIFKDTNLFAFSIMAVLLLCVYLVNIYIYKNQVKLFKKIA